MAFLHFRCTLLPLLLLALTYGAWSAALCQQAEALADAPSSLLRTSDGVTPELFSAPAAHDAAGSTSAPAVPPAPVTAHERRVSSEMERNSACESGELRGRPCRVSWPRVLGESFLFLSAQHGFNIQSDDDARFHLLHHTDGFWGDYATTLRRYRYNRWNDDDPFGVDYVGHPIMGALTNSIYEQNDPKQRALVYENTRRYWMGRLRATAYSAAYSAQWKIGPLSEASIGNIGIKTYYSPKLGRYTNETGMVDFFVTPVGGTLWNIGEDYIDKRLFRRVAKNYRNPLLLVAASAMTPCKAGANLLRFRAPYYRDRDLESLSQLRR